MVMYLNELKTRYGSFHVPISADLISESLSVYGEWAQREIDLLECFISVGDIVVDAGAYIGTHTRAFSCMVGLNGRVHGFEPDPTSFQVLQKNTENSSVANVDIYNIGLGKQEESLFLNIDSEAHNRAVASMIHYRQENGVEVKVKTLDSLELGVVDFIKVDVEGMELEFLQGARKTIQNSLPVIFLEANSLEESAGFLEWAAKHSYSVYGINVPAFNPDNFLECKDNIFGAGREAGLLLIPLSKVDQYSNILAREDFPVIDSLDALALLLLHKPQYLDTIVAAVPAVQKIGLDFVTPNSRHQHELQLLVDAKSAALIDASAAYKDLRSAFDQKQEELIGMQKALYESNLRCARTERNLEKQAGTVMELKAALDDDDRVATRGSN